MNDDPEPQQQTSAPISKEFAKRVVAFMATRKKDSKCKVCKIRLRSAGPGCPWNDCPHDKQEYQNGQ